MLGSPVTPPALGAGELASSNLAISTKKYQYVKYFNYLCNMSDKVRIKGMIIGLIIWAMLVIFVTLFMTGCLKTKPDVESGDVVELCVIDSVVCLGPHSTIEPDNVHKYFTSKGVEFTSRNNYMIGDTVVFVYKKVK